MLGQVLNRRYKLTRVLGAGGFGQTFLAADTQRPASQCVVKQLRPASQDDQFLKVARRLFETEVHTLRRLGEHPRIPALLDSFEEKDEFYLVQEFIDGETLRDELQREGQLSEAEVITLLRETLTTLKFVHEHRVVHRDLKPDNVMRRRTDRQLFLIDFGAVKEIRTQLVSGEITSLTVGIGTQGYTPSEQLSGKPRYSSDLFALGMTAIHALTGRSPADIPEDGTSLELHWEPFANVSPGLAILLKKMVRHYFYQRYQSVDEVLKDLDRLDELPNEVQLDPLLPTYMPVPTVWQPTWKESLRTVAIATVAASAVTLGIRQIGGWVPFELGVRDWLISHRQPATPDPRITLVEITEADYSREGRTTLSDSTVAEAIATLQQHSPAVIGLDLHRDISQPPGTEQLRQLLSAPNIVGITKIGTDNDSIPPPPGMPPKQIGFNDVPIDADSRLRRNLLFAELPNGSEVMASFGLQVALQYLERQHNISSTASKQNPEHMKVGEVTFVPLTQTFGAYQAVDSAGYQVLLDYRSPQAAAHRVSITQLLSGEYEPAWIADQIVLIGTTAYTSNDKFFTPYSLRGGATYEMSGVEVHAQMIAQILSAVLDDQPLPWSWPEGAEIAWILICAGGGGATTWLVRQPRKLVVDLLAGAAGIAGIGVACFWLGGWVPVVAPSASFLLAGAGLLAYRRHRQRQIAQATGYYGPLA